MKGRSLLVSVLYSALSAMCPLGRVAPAGDIGGTNPGIITTTLLTRENLQQKIYFGKYFWGHKYFLQRNISC